MGASPVARLKSNGAGRPCFCHLASYNQSLRYGSAFECQVAQLAALIGLFRVGGLVFQDKHSKQSGPSSANARRQHPSIVVCLVGDSSGAATLPQTKFLLLIRHLVLPERCRTFCSVTVPLRNPASQLHGQTRQTTLTRPPCRKPVLEITKIELTVVLSKTAGQY